MTVAVSFGMPEQPVIPRKCVASLLEYEQAPVIPATWNVPVEAKPVVDATMSVPPARLCAAPLTVVAAAPGAMVSIVTVFAARLRLPSTYAIVVRKTTLTATAMPIPEFGSVVGALSVSLGVMLPSSLAVVPPAETRNVSLPLVVPR